MVKASYEDQDWQKLKKIGWEDIDQFLKPILERENKKMSLLITCQSCGQANSVAVVKQDESGTNVSLCFNCLIMFQVGAIHKIVFGLLEELKRHGLCFLAAGTDRAALDIQDRVLFWLGNNREKLDPVAITDLQKICGIDHTKKQK